jgi:outer membrane protein OmpA-like peptidoglycan-associated protein
MPKGFGGMDLYKVIRDVDGKWGVPQNLGALINTAENELYPFVSNNMLFFASKGMNGFGGYDLYQAKITLGVPGAPTNMGQPFNSSKDDVAFICLPNGRTGYFSSNRDNGEGIDKVYYYFDNKLLTEPKPVVVVSADTVPKPKPGPVIAAKPHGGITKPAEIKKPVTQADTPVTAAAKPDKPKATVSKVSDEDLLKLVFDKVYFKFNDIAVPASSYITLDSAVHAAHMSRTVKIAVNAHTDSRGSAAYNQRLSERRAAAVKKYLVHKGVPSAQIITHGLGETQLLNKCSDGVECTEEEHQQNRRVEIRIVK